MDCCGADAATLRLTTRTKMVDYLPVPLASIEEAVDEIRRGGMVILMDDKDRENEGDLCMAAEKVTPEAINFMATHGRGLICLPLTEEQVRHLGIAMMVSDNTSPFGTAFTVSVDAATGITTGISAADRAKTILDAIADDAKRGAGKVADRIVEVAELARPLPRAIGDGLPIGDDAAPELRPA